MALDADAQADRERLYMALQMVAAGEPVPACLYAAVDLLGSLLAFASETPEEADKIAADLLADVRRDVRESWQDSREARARIYLERRLTA